MNKVLSKSSFERGESLREEKLGSQTSFGRNYRSALVRSQEDMVRPCFKDVILKSQKRLSKLQKVRSREIPHKTAILGSKKCLIPWEKVLFSSCITSPWVCIGQTTQNCKIVVFPLKRDLFRVPKRGGRQTLFRVKCGDL